MFGVMKNCFLVFWFAFFLFALTLINGQVSNSQPHCDHIRLERCQRDITTNIQDLSGSQSGYSGISSGYQSSGQSSDTHSRCSAIRQNLDCLLMYNAPCHARDNRGVTDSRTTIDNRDRDNSADFIRRAKQTLERYCEQGGGGWRTASCFTRQDVRNCESQFSFTATPPNIQVSTSQCRNYQDFRDCVIRIVRQSCYSQDLQLMATYLIDKTADLSWSCVLNDYGDRRSDSNYNSNDPYRGSNYDNRDNRYGSGSQYDRDRAGYDSNRDRNYDRDRVNTYDRDRTGYGGSSGYGGTSGGGYGTGTGTGTGTGVGGYGGTGYTGSGGSAYGSTYQGGVQGGINQPIDRFGGDSCLERAGYFVRTCEDTLIQRQRDAREGRSSNDVQRRICCALFFYRDCISRVVVDRCRDPSPTAVDILMGSRKRDLTVTCREYSRDQCSHSTLIKSSFSVILSIFISLMFFKPNIL